MQLPYGDKVDPKQILYKLETYALDTNHSRGKHKARLFKAKLGIELVNKEILVEALLNAAIASDATFSHSDEYGDRYVLDFNLETESGSSMVRSAWIIRTGEQYPRLTSVYPI